MLLQSWCLNKLQVKISHCKLGVRVSRVSSQTPWMSLHSMAEPHVAQVAQQDVCATTSLFTAQRQMCPASPSSLSSSSCNGQIWEHAVCTSVRKACGCGGNNTWSSGCSFGAKSVHVALPNARVSTSHLQSHSDLSTTEVLGFRSYCSSPNITPFQSD